MNTPEPHSDAVLLHHRSDGNVILVDRNRKTETPVQSRLVQLLADRPGTPVEFVALSDLQKAAREQPRKAADGLRREDISDLSGSEGRLLRYFQAAAELGASDIHFLITGELFRVRMRIHGELCTVDERPPAEGYALLGTAILSVSDVSEPMFFPKREQDARLQASFMRRAGLFGARYSHRPTPDGLYAVMRLIADDASRVPTPEQLGFLPEQCRLLARMYRRPEGLLLLTGPTGSGKSTTLRSLCRAWIEHNQNRRSLLTIEDPVEGAILDAIQTALQADKSDENAVRLAWSRAVSSAMRLDPDAIMEGEIRDLLSLIASIYAAQTGHLLLSTLHTNSALGILPRMVTMGADINLIADASLMIGMVSQRLVPELCPHCRIPWSARVATLDAENHQMLETFCSTGSCHTGQLFFRNPDGCGHCRREVVINGEVRAVVSQGLRGRTVIAEVIEPDNRLFDLYRRQGLPAARGYWLKSLNGISRVEHLRLRCAEGRVDPLLACDIIPLDEDIRFALTPEET